jgi:hypothetical protein
MSLAEMPRALAVMQSNRTAMQHAVSSNRETDSVLIGVTLAFAVTSDTNGVFAREFSLLEPCGSTTQMKTQAAKACVDASCKHMK